MRRQQFLQGLACPLFTGYNPVWAQQQPSLPPAAWASRRLEEILELVERGQLRLALRQAKTLSEQFPRYAPAQMVYADLLMWHSARTGAPPVSAQAAWRDLQQEIKLRRLAFSQRPPANSLPAQVISLGAHTKKMLVIDTAKARLYALSIEAEQVKPALDFFVSVGRLGVDKQVEGDEKTPLGIYAITRKISQVQLRDRFFGSGALPINYPNPFDRFMGKTGFGIWFHGSPEGQPSRAVLSTNGCIVLADSDMQEILHWVQTYRTPVIVGSNISWQPVRRGTSAGAETILEWQSQHYKMRAFFDPAHAHAYERDMVRYAVSRSSQGNAWQLMNRQGQLVGDLFKLAAVAGS